MIKFPCKTYIASNGKHHEDAAKLHELLDGRYGNDYKNTFRWWVIMKHLGPDGNNGVDDPKMASLVIKNIGNAERAAIYEAQLFIYMVSEPSYGALIELGIAIATGKHIIVYHTKEDTALTKCPLTGIDRVTHVYGYLDLVLKMDHFIGYIKEELTIPLKQFDITKSDPNHVKALAETSFANAQCDWFSEELNRYSASIIAMRINIENIEKASNAKKTM